LNQTKLLFPLIFISLEDDSSIVIPPQPTSPGEIMSGGEGEPVEADAPAKDETVSPQGTHVTGTQTVTHEYLTLNGKVARETIRTNNTLTAVLDFVYDESGKPFALKYSTNGTSFETYYYVLNLQGDVVKLIHYIPGFEYESVATYEYDAWGNIVSSSGRLAEINPLRYRGYYYDNETGFYYLQSRYYDPANRRFINADSLSSTGRGFVGTNMFTYCNNCPIVYRDSAGTAPVETIDINSDGVVDCYIYEYTYESPKLIIFGWNAIKTTETGKVYIYINPSSDYMANPENFPQGSARFHDFVATDYGEDDNSNPNIQVRNSYFTNNKSQQMAIIDVLIDYASENKPNWKRTRESLYIEWREHNRYALFSESAKHVDFDNNEEGCSAGYYFRKALRNMLN